VFCARLVPALGRQQEKSLLLGQDGLPLLVQEALVTQNREVAGVFEHLQCALALIGVGGEQAPIHDDAVERGHSQQPEAVVGFFLGGAVPERGLGQKQVPFAEAPPVTLISHQA